MASTTQTAATVTSLVGRRAWGGKLKKAENNTKSSGFTTSEIENVVRSAAAGGVDRCRRRHPTGGRPVKFK